MKKIILAFAIIIGFSFVVFADDSFSWIDPDPVLGKQSQQNLKKQPVKKVLKKKRVLRKKKVSSEKPLQESPAARKTSKTPFSNSSAAKESSRSKARLSKALCLY